MAYSFGDTVIYTDPKTGRRFIARVFKEWRDATVTIHLDRPLSGGKLKLFDPDELRVQTGTLKRA
jgi:hypothetical protein